MIKKAVNLAIDSGHSLVVKRCQVCDCPDLKPVLFLGYMPPVNKMSIIGSLPEEQPSYPALLLYCPDCQLVQLGLVVDAKILFPAEYPYTSGTTRILRDNFAELYQDCRAIVKPGAEDLVVDIGSNDGTLLSNFASHHRVQGITPEEIGKLAIERGIPTLISYFNRAAVEKVIAEKGKAKVITATNVFAHIENIHEVIDCILELLQPDGVFISESHYLISLLETIQYDTIYHEHLRYYSLHSLKYLLDMRGLEVIHAKRIPTHGGSIRVYACRRGAYPPQDTVAKMLKTEEALGIGERQLAEFKAKVVISKLQLYSLLSQIKASGRRIYGIGAPSRASTLINYVGLDDGILDCVLEVKDSHKLGKYMPGTLIPVLEESKLFQDQPEYVLLLSWHIAEELMPKIKEKGFKGDFIIPLPNPRIVKGNKEVNPVRPRPKARGFLGLTG
ncbi:MAG: class I SAM-dependent methyltransferase [Candidatus Omnitrophica bacterium]|nr:class I SAM-dependent methyltransferase [Candidatus Omnitrophota bacterium]